MKVLMIFAASVAVATAQFVNPVYGPPEPSQQPGNGNNGNGGGAQDFSPQTFRHVFVHSAPDEPVDEQARTIRIPGGDRHINVIFLKTPSQSSQSQTEVILPEQDEQKNLVYVLLKKNEAENNIRIRRPQNKTPQKPEVYFIRYKDQEQQQNGGPGGYSQGPSHNGNGNGHSNGNGHRGNGNSNGNGHHGNGNGNGNGHHGNGNGIGNGHHGNGNGNGHHGNGNGNGNGHHGNGNGNGNAPPPTFDFNGPISQGPSPRQNGNGNGGYSEAGRYTPAHAPGPIRSPSDVPSSQYGVPL